MLDVITVLLMLCGIAGMIYGLANQKKKDYAKNVSLISSLVLIASVISFFNPFGCSSVDGKLEENFNVAKMAKAEGIVDYVAKKFPSSTAVMLYDDAAVGLEKDLIEAVRAKASANGITFLDDVSAASDDEQYFMSNSSSSMQRLSVATLDDALKKASDADLIICFVHFPASPEELEGLKFWDSNALRSGKAKLLMLNDDGMDMLQNLRDDIIDGNVAGVLMNKTYSFDTGREDLPDDWRQVFDMSYEFADKDNLDKIAKDRNWNFDDFSGFDD